MAQLSCTKCSVCNEKNGTLYCHDCEHFLCQTCKQLHDIFPANKQHIVIDVNKEGRRVFKAKPICEDHKKDYAFYCKKCDRLICSECITSTHCEHPCGDYKTIIENLRQHMIVICEQLQTKVTQIEKSRQTIQTDIVSKVKFDSEEFVRHVHSTANEFDKIIAHVKTMYETTASDYTSTEIENVRHVQDQLENLQKNYLSLYSKSENMLLEQHNVTFFFEHKSIQNELGNLEEIPNMPEPKHMSDFKPDNFTDLVVEEIQKKFTIRSLQESIDENNRLKVRLQETEQHKLSKEAESQQFNDKLKEEQKKSTKLKEDNDRLESEIAILVEIKKRNTDEIVQLNESLGQEQDTVAKLQRFRRDIAELVEIDERQTPEIVELNENFRQEQAIVGKLQSLKRSVKDVIDENNRLKMRLHETELCEESLQGELQCLTRQNMDNDLRRKSKDNQEVIFELEQMIKLLKQNLNKCQEKNTELEKENACLRVTKPKEWSLFPWSKQKQETVQIYADDIDKKLINELEELLSMQFRNTKTLLVVKKYQNLPIDSRIPLIVVCRNVSRLKTDIDIALSNVSISLTKALVVIHYTPIHALRDFSSKTLVSYREYEHLSDIVDMAYVKDYGIYQCEMNTNSLKRLVDFIHLNQQT